MFGSNILIMINGPYVDGAIYCDNDICKITWLRYQFYCVRISAILLTLFVFLLEIGLPILVKINGGDRKHYYNSYFIRGLIFIYLATLTQPDQEYKWYASIINGFSYFAYGYGLCLICITPVNFLLSFIPIGYPTSVKTQRPESTFWAVVTLVGCIINLLGFCAIFYSISWKHDGDSLAQQTYKYDVSQGDTTSYGKSLYIYQQFIFRLCLLFFIPLLFAAELEVTPILHNLPELRYLVTKGPLYLLIGTMLLTADDAWPYVNWLNFIGYSYICLGAAYLSFPAVRIVHELYGDRLSPKTRFYPGLYTFFSVWGVVMSIFSLVMFIWQTIAYDATSWGFADKYQWYSLKVCGYICCIIALFTELELEIFYEVTVGSVPIHFDFLRNWISRSFLYLFIACLCAQSSEKVDGDYTLFDITRTVMWAWVSLAIVYVVFFLHLVSSAMLYKLYIANEAWFQKTIADNSVSETTSLLNGNDDDDDVEGGNSAWSQSNPSNIINRKSSSNTLKNNNTNTTSQDTNIKESMKRFVLQQGGKLVISPIKFIEESGGALGKVKVSNKSATVAAAADADGGDNEVEEEEDIQEIKPQNFYVRGILYDEEGQSKKVDAVLPEKPKKGKPLPKVKKAKQLLLNAHAAYQASLENKRIFCWTTSHIPLEVSQKVSEMGKEAAIDVQVWCRAPVKSTWALAGAEDVQVFLPF